MFESYSFNVGKVRLHWRDGTPVDVIGDVHLPEFVHVGYNYGKATFTYPGQRIYTGKWRGINSYHRAI